MDIYIDDATGKYYTWNGSSFVEYTYDSDNEPQIGSHGDESITDEEEKERQKQIDQEEQENPEQNKNIKSDAERIKDITREMSDEQTGDNLDIDRVRVSQKERERQKKLARRNAAEFKGNKAGLTKFKADFSKFIKNEVAAVEVSTWSRPNRRYVDTPFIMPGTREEDNLSIPSVRVYFDHSGSWDERKIADGKAIIESIVKDYVNKKKLTIEILYFGNQVSTDPQGTGSGTYGQPIMEDIRTYKPDNVIIMTDSDIDDLSSTTTVKGGVFLLFKGGVSTNLQEHIRGRKITRSYEI